MTVCIATLFRWNYAPLGQPPKHGIAGFVASDRKITAGDIEYEPQQLKLSFITPRTVIMIAGDYAIHSEALRKLSKIVQNNAAFLPENVALQYGQQIQAIKRRYAEDLYLSPLGMNTDTFLSQQKEFSDGFVARITDQLQRYQGEPVEALIV